MFQTYPHHPENSDYTTSRVQIREILESRQRPGNLTPLPRDDKNRICLDRGEE